MRSDKEHKIQCEFIRWVRLSEKRHKALALLYAVPNGGHRNITTARKMKAEGVKAGVPDICLPVPNGAYSSLYIEMKTEKGRQSKIQEEYAALLEAFGSCYRICRNAHEAISTVKNYLKI